MPTIRYVQWPSAAASSAQLRPEHVSSGGATGTSAIALAGAGPDNKFAGPTAPADDSSSNNDGIKNSHASTHARGESEGAGRLLSAPPPPPPPPGVGIHAGQVSQAQAQAQAQLQQKAVVTPDKPTAVSRFDTPDDDANQFADADEDDGEDDDENGKDEGSKVDNDTLLASASRQNQSTSSCETSSSLGLQNNQYSTTKPAAADNSTTMAAASAPNTTAPHAHKMPAGQFDDLGDDLPSAANVSDTIANTSNGEEPPQVGAGLQEIEVPGEQEAAKEGHANSEGGAHADAAAHAEVDAKVDTTDPAVGDDDDPNTTAATEVEAAADVDVAAGADAGASSSDPEPEEYDATELPPAFKIEIGKAIVRLQKQIKEDVLDKTHLRSIGCILGKRHKLIGPGLFKETLELPEVKDSDAATEDVKERIAKWEAVVETKNIIHGVGPHDVLFGRGGRTNIHEGNIYFRNLLQKYKMDYINASKNTKPDLSREIVYIWRNLEPVSLTERPACSCLCAGRAMYSLGRVNRNAFAST